MEVPEIYDGTVQIRAAARVKRASGLKLPWPAAIKTLISRRLRGNEGHARAIHHSRIARRKNRYYSFQRRDRGIRAESLEPGKSDPRQIMDAENRLEVIVEDSQLSLAIGKKGQNVRLGKQANWLEHRYQERRREAPGN